MKKHKIEGALYIVMGRDDTVTGVKGRRPRIGERVRMRTLKELFPECRVVLGHASDRMWWAKKVTPEVVFLGYDQEAFVQILKTELSLLKRIGVLRTNVVRLKPYKEATYKSSKIKAPHVVVRGEVVHGKKMGRHIGYPTANVSLNKGMKKVVAQSGARGIYAARALLSSGEAVTGTQNKSIKTYLAAVVVGAREENGAPLVEAHLIGFRGDCYGQTLTLSLEKKLRDFKVYTNDEQLKKDIGRDVAQVRKFFAE
jgi:glycerol-3-phosphate cytidylyltransferase-like family protein